MNEEDKAERARQRLRVAPTEALREQIADTFSVSPDKATWLVVFADDADMIARFAGVVEGAWMNVVEPQPSAAPPDEAAHYRCLG